MRESDVAVYTFYMHINMNIHIYVYNIYLAGYVSNVFKCPIYHVHTSYERTINFLNVMRRMKYCMIL